MNNKTKTQENVHIQSDLDFTGKIVGKYKIVREINRGGMGIVCESYQENLKRKVAIKILPLTSCHLSSTTERFKREASIVAKIKHPGVCQIYDFGKDENYYYIVMEYVEGENLEDVLKKRKLNIEEAIQIFKKILNILNDLHSQKIVHRDIKPANIIIKENKDVILLDFGISKCLDEETLYKITHQPIGTPAYMPPEFLKSDGKNADVRSDVYSLGIMAYEMFTGVLPFGDNNSYHEIIDKIRESDFILPRRINQIISKPLETIILKCMAYNPANRFGSVHEILTDIQNYENNQPLKSKRFLVLYDRLKKDISSAKYKISYAIITIVFLAMVSGYLINANKQDENVKSLSSNTEWKKFNFLKNSDFYNGIRVFRDIEGEVEVMARDQFVTFDKSQKDITWLRNMPGYIIFDRVRANDVSISFSIKEESQEDEYYGLFVNSSAGVSGYILKIYSNKILLCKDYHENVLKEYDVNFLGNLGEFVFERLGAEINVYFNSEKIIQFIDYNPITSEENIHAGFFFNKGFRKLYNLHFEIPKQALAVSPLIIGQKFYEIRNLDKAINEFNKIIEEYPDEKIAFIASMKVGICYKELKKFNEAIAIFDTLLKNPGYPELFPEISYQKGICKFNLNDSKGAEEVYQNLILAYKDSDIALNILMFLYEMINSKLKTAETKEDLAFVEDRLSFIINNYPLKRPLLTSIFRNLINKLIKKGMINEAIAYLKNLEEYFPNQTTTLAWGGIISGELFESLKQYDNAETMYIEALTKYPGLRAYEAWAQFNQASLYCKTGRIKEAINVSMNIIRNYNDQIEFVNKAKALIEEMSEKHQQNQIKE